VETVSLDAGHEITRDDVAQASGWLSKDPEDRVKEAVG